MEPFCRPRDYTFIEILGQGAFSTVWLIYDNIQKKHFAGKKIQSIDIDCERRTENLSREIKNTQALDHPNIIQLIDYFKTPDSHIIVLEYAKGGELHDYVMNKGNLSEKKSRFFVRQIISAVDHCHCNSIAHRDIKLENVMLDAEGNAKLNDFGLSRQFEPEQLVSTFCGTFIYAAPELLTRVAYDPKGVDVWSIGVLLYCMLTGRIPWDATTDYDLKQSIISCNFSFPLGIRLSASCKACLKKILVNDPKKRATIEQLRHDPWINEGYSDLPPEIRNTQKVVTRGNIDNALVDELSKKCNMGGPEVKFDILMNDRTSQPFIEYQKLLRQKNLARNEGKEEVKLPQKKPFYSSFFRKNH